MNDYTIGSVYALRNRNSEPLTFTRPVLSFKWLCEMMQKRVTVTLLDTSNKPVYGVIGHIQAEDGSGKCWNVKLDDRWIFVRAE
jgi:hypothetical protein